MRGTLIVIRWRADFKIEPDFLDERRPVRSLFDGFEVPPPVRREMPTALVGFGQQWHNPIFATGIMLPGL